MRTAAVFIRLRLMHIRSPLPAGTYALVACKLCGDNPSCTCLPQDVIVARLLRDVLVFDDDDWASTAQRSRALHRT